MNPLASGLIENTSISYFCQVLEESCFYENAVLVEGRAGDPRHLSRPRPRPSTIFISSGKFEQSREALLCTTWRLIPEPRTAGSG